MTMKTVKYYPWCSKYNSTISTPKEEWIPVKGHERFLYHLTYGGSQYPNQERLFFRRLNYGVEGLCCKDKGTNGVWANNQMNDIHTLWPVAIDSWDAWTTPDYLRRLLSYDIWRIDTTLIDNHWYLDPNLIGDPTGSRKASDYLFTEGSVHPRALRLFHFYINEYQFLYEDLRTAQFSLVPVKEVNEFIWLKWRNH